MKKRSRRAYKSRAYATLASNAANNTATHVANLRAKPLRFVTRNK